MPPHSKSRRSPAHRRDCFQQLPVVNSASTITGPVKTKKTNALLVLDRVTIRGDEHTRLSRINWMWQRGEQWAVLGPNGSGKSLLALALCGKAPLQKGEIQYASSLAASAAAPESSIALLSPQIQRERMASESSFYQSRWHSGVTESHRTVAQFLSQASVEDRNPFEIGGHRGNPRQFHQDRRRLIRWLGIAPLLRRKLAALSNGEQRKVFLVHTLLSSPRLLILDDPFAGLDRATRTRLKTVIQRLMRRGLPVLLITSRPDELPAGTTHVLLIDHHRLIAQGTRSAMLNHPLARPLATTSSASSFSSASSKNSIGKTRPGTSLVELRHATIRIGNRRILTNITWTMRRSEHWAVIGPNGSGKTTLLSLIQGDHPQAYALDLRIFGTRPDTTQAFWRRRRQIGWLSPELHAHYPAAWSCLDVVCSGFFNSVGLYEPCTARQRAAARSWLRRFNLEREAKSAFGELSLGDQRLVLLARAAVRRPKLLILDEPGQGLDTAHRRTLLATVDHVVRQTAAHLVLVTHHPGELPGCINRVLQLKAGRIRNSLKRRPQPSPAATAKS